MNNYLNTLHGGRHSNEDGVAAILKAGTDLECPNFPILKNCAQSALDKHQINISEIDTAISRKFLHFVALGELEGPQEIELQKLGPEDVDTTEHRLLSLSVAEQVITSVC
jgi:beta-glucosidase-like glycosyl hydrolase